MNGENSDQSLTVLRNYLRYAISSIVYHKLFPASSHEDRENKIDESKSQRGGKQQHLCFVERDFCGLSGLKYMDAVTDNGDVTNMDGAYTSNLFSTKEAGKKSSLITQ